MIETLPLPVTDNPIDAPFWAGARRGELLVQRCGSCGEHRFPPRPRCPHCHSADIDWVKVSGRGEVYSFVIPRPPLLPAFERLSPYVVALVSLVELPTIRMVGMLIAAESGTAADAPGVDTPGADAPVASAPGARLDPARCYIGEPVTAEFVALAEDVHLLRWRLSVGGGERA